jgi:hypothetical protein
MVAYLAVIATLGSLILAVVVLAILSTVPAWNARVVAFGLIATVTAGSALLARRRYQGATRRPFRDRGVGWLARQPGWRLALIA